MCICVVISVSHVWCVGSVLMRLQQVVLCVRANGRVCVVVCVYVCVCVRICKVRRVSVCACGVCVCVCVCVHTYTTSDLRHLSRKGSDDPVFQRAMLFTSPPPHTPPPLPTHTHTPPCFP